MSVQNTSPVFLDNGEFFMNNSNIVNVFYPYVSQSFSKAKAASTSTFLGFDWTLPYPGKSDKDGHLVQLTIAGETFVDKALAENSTTVLSSLTFGIPKHMKSDGKALPMDPSWYICRHIFISTDATIKKSADRGRCDTLSQDCQNDLAAALTWKWGSADDDTMCSQQVANPIPQSCGPSFGFSRQDVLIANSTALADSVLGPLQTSVKQQQYSWRIGTGYHHPRDPVAYELAANRTYLVATVWGFSKGTNPKDVKIPRVSWTCLSGGDPYVPHGYDFPDPPPHLHDNSTSTSPPSSATTSAATSSGTATSTTTSSAPASTTTTSGGPTSAKISVQLVYLFATMLIATFVLGDYA